MQSNNIERNVKTKYLTAVMLCLAMAAALMLPFAANAEGTGKTVRVGWYESPANMTDQYGRRSGYAYDYQEKIAAYTGWNYEYVKGSWPELLQMLIDGKIDLLNNVSFTPERAELMLFPSLPVGSEEYYIFISPDNKDYTPGDYSYFNGKKVGANKGSIQAGLYREWEKANGINSELIEWTGSEEEAVKMLQTGKLDAYAVIEGYSGNGVAVPVIKIGSSNFYLAVKRDRNDLLDELNSALVRIQDENRFYNEEMYSKYVSTAGANLFLNSGEKEWLSGHGTIRVGYQDKHLSFCALDEKTGELTGALKDYLKSASTCFENAALDFEPAAYPSAAAAIEALKKGEVDCVFPSSLSTSDAETQGLVMTPSMISAELYAVVRKTDQQTFLHKERITAAVEAGNPNYDTVMMDYFPDWQRTAFPDIHACLKAVADGKADCLLISNYQYNNLARQCEKLGLTALATGKNVDYCFAVQRGGTELYSILSRTTNIVSSARINAALSYFAAEDARTSLLDLIKDNPEIDIAVIVVIIALLAVIFMQHRMIRAKKEVEESHHQVDALNKRVFVDALTSVRNKGGFNEYIRGLQKRLDNKEQLEFAIAVFDCDNLKMINDQYGHDKGDVYLQTASRLISRVFKHSPVFRIGGDEFAAVLLNDDHRDKEALTDLFYRSAEEIRASANNKWEQVSVAMGMAEFNPQNDDSVDDVIRRADKTMYENKRKQKEAKQSM